MVKQTKVITRRRKFLEVEIPLLNQKIELIGENPDELKDRTIKLDLTRHLKGKSVEGIFRLKIDNKKIIAGLYKLKLMSYFIRRMIRKRVSYVEDSFQTPSQENMIFVKPFLITRMRVSRVVRKTLRNKARNWIEDYIAERKNDDIFTEILSNKLQKQLSLVLKKTYPLSLCEIRILEIKRPLNKDEIPKKKAVEKTEELEESIKKQEEEKIEEAVKEIKKVQKKAAQKEKEIEEKQEDTKSLEEKTKEDKKKTTKNITAKKEKLKESVKKKEETINYPDKK